MSDELDDVFEKVKGEKDFGGGGLSKLPDGKYTFEVLGAEFKKAKYTTFALKIAAQHGDAIFEGKHEYWLIDKDGANERNLNNCKADLKALGLDVDEWTRANLRPFGEELTKACRVLVGIKIDGAKKENEGKDKKVYCNIYINGRAMTAEKTTLDGKPAKFNAHLIQEAVDLAESNPF